MSREVEQCNARWKEKMVYIILVHEGGGDLGVTESSEEYY